jgi:hypothetical protein
MAKALLMKIPGLVWGLRSAVAIILIATMVFELPGMDGRSGNQSSELLASDVSWSVR